MEAPGSKRKLLWVALVALAVVGIAGVGVAMWLGALPPKDEGPDSKPQGSTASGDATSSVPATLSAAAAAVPPGGVVTLDAGEKTGKFKLLIFLWNDTRERPLKDTVITWGESGRWIVDTTMAAERATIGPFRTGTKLTLTIYPDGESGRKCTVPFQIGGKMLSGSERDGVHVEIRDDGVHVLGNPIDNFDRGYPR